MPKLIKLILLTTVIFSALPASATVPDIWGLWTWEHTEPVHLMVTPSGSGPSFAEASFPGGGTADAIILIQIWYQDGWTPPTPLAGFPAEDIWLDSPGLVPCMGGSIADDNTDDEGWITFSLPPRMGGWTDISSEPAALQVFIMGDVLRDEDGDLIAPAFAVNSPDINGDLYVNLADVGMFSSDFFGQYSFRSDFYWDGILNLADVGRLATGMGSQCP